MTLPCISIGNHSISRLIVGGNPLSGNSHVSPSLDNEMLDYYTVEKIKQCFLSAISCGINTVQLRGDMHTLRLMREVYLQGISIQWIAQTAPEMGNFRGHIAQVARMNPIGIYLQGTTTDALYKAGKISEIKDHLTVIRDSGISVGLGTHMPEVIDYAEEHAFDVDFYECCVYNLSKVTRVSSVITGKSNTQEPFDEEDIPIMYRSIASAKKPCLAFKILGASRRCQDQDHVKSAFKEAFDNIKPSDGVVVGMFQKYQDEVAMNAQYVKEILNG